MSGKLRLLVACSLSVCLGLAASVLCVLVRRSVPSPRWDLILSLSLTLIGLVGCLAIARSSDTRTVAARTSKYWWPRQRTALLGFGMWAWFLPVFFVVSAALVPSGQAWQIAEAGETIRPLPVKAVLKSDYVQSGKTSHYANEVQVSVPFDEDSRTIRGGYSSDSAAKIGDVVYALYSPSSPSLGALIDSNRSDLEREIGGPAGAVEILLVIMYVGLIGWVYSLIGLRPGPADAVKNSLPKGIVRALRVTVDGVEVRVDERPAKGAQGKQVKPCVRLAPGRGGPLNLYLDQAIDPARLAPILEVERADLYWRPPLQKLPYGESVGHAVLILSSGHCIPGWLETPDGSVLPEGEVVTELHEGPELRAIYPMPVLDPALYARSIGVMSLGVLALLIMSFGVGTFGTVVLATIASLSPFVARRSYRKCLAQKLQRFHTSDSYLGA